MSNKQNGRGEVNWLLLSVHGMRSLGTENSPRDLLFVKPALYNNI